VLTTPEGSTVLRNSPHIRNLIVYDRREADRGIVGFARTISRIRHAGPYAAAYLAQGSMRSALLVASAGVRKRIGFNTSEGRRLYTDRVEYRTDRHHAERLWWLSMSECADAPSSEQTTPRVFPSADDERAADSVVQGQLRNPSRPFVVLAPGSAWGTKRWPFYPELALRVAEQCNVVVVGGNGEEALGDSIVAQVPEGCAANAAGRLGILASAALIGRAAAIVCNDSAPQHLASAMNTPTVGVFGPTVPQLGFGPLARNSTVAGNDDLACRPCDRHGPQRCPLGHWRCMRELSWRDVFDLLTQTLSQAAYR